MFNNKLPDQSQPIIYINNHDRMSYMCIMIEYSLVYTKSLYQSAKIIQPVYTYIIMHYSYVHHRCYRTLKNHFHCLTLIIMNQFEKSF